MKVKLRRGTKSLIYLLACALNNEIPDMNRIPPKDIECLFELCRRHMTGSMAGAALSAAYKEQTQISASSSGDDQAAESVKKDLTEGKKPLEREYIKKWESVKNAALKRRVLFDMERKSVLSELEKKGIWYCPLKGVILQDFYPGYEMREMSDNDILYDAGFRDELVNLMLARGYRVENEGVTNHDLFVKEPVYNFEFHTRLFMHTFSTVFTAYYDGIKKRLIKDEDNNEGYHFSDEDFYIYITAHAFKHYSEGGTGLRSLADVYVFLKKKQKNMDMGYVRREVKKLGMGDFERKCRTIAGKLFSDPGDCFENIASLDEGEREFLSYISKTGAYCTKEDFVKSKIRTITGKKENTGMSDRLKYYMARLFPDESYYKEAHPFLYKNKPLIPAFLMLRAFRAVARNRDGILKEISTVRSTGAKRPS